MEQAGNNFYVRVFQNIILTVNVNLIHCVKKSAFLCLC